jgi:hypothetical protein
MGDGHVKIHVLHVFVVASAQDERVVHVRVPEALYRRLRAQAEADRRATGAMATVSSVVRAVLVRAFAPSNGAGPDRPRAKVLKRVRS